MHRSLRLAQLTKAAAVRLVPSAPAPDAAASRRGGTNPADELLPPSAPTAPGARALVRDCQARCVHAVFSRRRSARADPPAVSLVDLAAASEVASILESRISGSTAGADVQETGRVLTIGDGIARCVPSRSPDARAPSRAR